MFAGGGDDHGAHEGVAFADQLFEAGEGGLDQFQFLGQRGAAGGQALGVEAQLIGLQVKGEEFDKLELLERRKEDVRMRILKPFGGQPVKFTEIYDGYNSGSLLYATSPGQAS